MGRPVESPPAQDSWPEEELRRQEPGCKPVTRCECRVPACEQGLSSVLAALAEKRPVGSRDE